jgi:hypothetical protein
LSPIFSGAIHSGCALSRAMRTVLSGIVLLFEDFRSCVADADDAVLEIEIGFA